MSAAQTPRAPRARVIGPTMPRTIARAQGHQRALDKAAASAAKKAEKLATKVAKAAKAKRAKHLRENKVHDTRANRLTAMGQDNDENGGALVRASTANERIVEAKKKLEDAIMALSRTQEEGQQLVDAARRELADLRHRYQTIDDSVHMHPETGEFEPVDEAERAANEADRVRLRELQSEIPMTYKEYVLGLHREFTSAGGMVFIEGTHSTTFVCHVVSAFEEGSMAERLQHAARSTHHQGEAIESFTWTNRYMYEPMQQQNLIAYLAADDKTAMGPDGEPINFAIMSEADRDLFKEAQQSGLPRPTLEKLNFRNISLIDHSKNAFARISFTIDPALMARIRPAIAPFLPAGAEGGRALRYCLPQNPGFSVLNNGDDLFDILYGTVEAKYPFEVYMERHDDPDRLYRVQGSADPAVVAPKGRYDRFIWEKFIVEYPEMAHIRSTSSLAFLIDNIIANNNAPVDSTNPMTQRLGDPFVPQLLSTSYMKVSAILGAVHIDDFIAKPKIVLQESIEGRKCCVYELIVRLWADSIHKAYEEGRFVSMKSSLPEISVPILRRYFGANDIDDYTLSIDNLMHFAKHFKIEIDVYNANMKMVQRVPRLVDNHHISPQHVAVVVKDGHVFHLDNDTSLFHKSQGDRLQLEPLHDPSAEYTLTDDKSITRMFSIETLDGLLGLDLASIPIFETRVSTADIRINSSLDAVVEQCLNKWNVTPSMTFSKTGRALTSVSIIISIGAVKEARSIKLWFRNPIAPGTLQIALSQAAIPEYAEHLNGRISAVRSSLINVNNLSRYNPAGACWWAKDNRGPLVGIFPGVDRGQSKVTFEFDAANAHISVVHKLKVLPKFSMTDYPEIYDGHAFEKGAFPKFEDNTSYMLKRTIGYTQCSRVQQILLDKFYSLMWGDELNEMWEYIKGVVEVRWFYRPFEVVMNESQEAIVDALTDLDLALKDVKNGYVVTCGNLGKRENKAMSTRVFKLESEARWFKETQGGRVDPYFYNLSKIDGGIDSTADSVWIWTSPVLATNLESGFLPIFNRILSGDRMIIAREALRRQAAGMDVLGANTDAVFVNKFELIEPFDKRDPANLGRTSCKAKDLPKGEIGSWADKEVGEPMLRPRQRLTTIDLKHENCNEMAPIVRSRDVLVLARAPGAGKTTILLCSFKVLHWEVLVIVQSNIRVVELRAMGFVAATYACFLGLRVEQGRLVDRDQTGNSIKRLDGSSASVHEFKHIMFDELATLASSERGRLTRRIKTLRNLEMDAPSLYATADVNQLPPIEFAINPKVDQKAYISTWMRDLFPHAVVLHKLRRWERPECQELILKVRRMLFEDRRPVAEVLKLFSHIKRAEIPEDAHIVSYTRDKRRELNKFMHDREFEDPWIEGSNIVYDSHPRLHGKKKLFKNFVYRIVSVNEANIDIVDVADAESTFRVSLAQAASWFAYPHANTCHSCQGSTYDMPVVIAESNHFRVTPEWLYVALTRNRDTSTVFILEGEPASKPIDKKAILNRIKGHNQADQAAKREVGDLTVDWVIERFKDQNGRCAICGDEMALPRIGAIQPRGSMVSIDRKISKEGRGHTRGNVQLTCFSCNCAKGNR